MKICVYMRDILSIWCVDPCSESTGSSVFPLLKEADERPGNEGTSTTLFSVREIFDSIIDGVGSVLNEDDT